MSNKISLQAMNRALLHEYYRGFVMDADIFMDMSQFREFHYDPERVDAYFEKLQSQKDRVDFLIMKDEKPIGEIALKHIDETARECELSIHLQNDAVKNQGYGTQAERLILEYAFQTLGMTAVIADSVLKNKRSQHTLEKVGFQVIGRDDTFVYYRISHSDWLKLGDE
ncbi:MAG: GNAT family N-acetyltransferase [Oscillospiraceae bacterium]|nr:GNAT family N-acetyltransferase [Oscillospiraceae bacterium]